MTTKISAPVGPGKKNVAADVLVVQTLLNRHAAWLKPLDAPKPTGVFDPATAAAIVAFQTEPGALAHPDGIVSPKGFTLRRLDEQLIEPPHHRIFALLCWHHPESGSLTADDYANAAKAIGCDAASIEAVARVETKRASFESDAGRPTILFERHYFSRLSNHAYDATHPDISNPVAGGYGTFAAQYKKLRRAALLDESAALQSASWGAFQIMGSNFKDAGFGSVDAFVDAMMASEKRHLEAFVSFIQASATMTKAIKAHDWATFARNYNGKDYKKNDYDVKMADEYAAILKRAK
jgi:hypothetical protein